MIARFTGLHQLAMKLQRVVDQKTNST